MKGKQGALNRTYPRLHTLRYMGSKLGLVDFIAPVVHELADGGGFVDLMAGTHSIGYALKPHVPVWANDVQNYSQVIGRTLLGPAPASLSIAELQSLITGFLAKEPPGFFEEVYADTYFSPRQCREIDAIRTAIAQIAPEARPLGLTALMGAMSHCQSTPGHFAQYLPPDHPRVQSLRKLRVVDLFFRKLQEIEGNLVPGVAENVITNVRAEELAVPDTAGVGYLDPPYTSDQYSRFYHLLETLVLYDAPAVRHKALYRQDRYRSDFCYPGRVEAAFRRILARWAKARRPLVISYSTRGLMPLAHLLSLAHEYYQDVRQLSTAYCHSSMGKGTKSVREVLIIAAQARLKIRR